MWGRLRARAPAAGAAGSAGSATRQSVRPPASAPLPTAPPAVALAAAASALLEIRGLEVQYGMGDDAVAAVRQIDLTVGAGEIVGLIGESGSGKTTVVSAMFALVPPPGRVTGGRIVFDGRDLLRLKEPDMRRVRGDRLALVPQGAQNALDPVMRILDQVAEAIVAHGRGDWPDARRRASALLASVRIPSERHRAYPHEFSGGMRQRVLIAMAMANQPDLIVADEPTTGLDGTVKLEVLELLVALTRKNGRSLLLVSHDLPAVFRVADRVAVMQEGRIIEVGTPDSLARSAEHPYTRRLLDAVPSGRGRQAATRAAAAGSGPLLEIRGVTKYFERGDVLALDDVSFDIGRGEIVGVVGESGAGKSTLARLVFGLEFPDAGRIHLNPAAAGRAETLKYQRTPSRRREELRRRQLVSQDPYSALPPHLRVGGIVAEPLRICGMREAAAAREAVATALAGVELRPAERFMDRYPHELSGGERQRVALARALIVDPDLIVADEPASLLDASLRRDLVAHLARARDERGTSILYITHDIGLAAELCDRLVVLDAGQVVEQGPAADVLARPAHPVTAEFVRIWRTLSAGLQPASSTPASSRISDTAGDAGS
ncbi:MAG: ATP-binding cassette domain-containing protein [Gemmatimonadota bacterium]